MRKFLLTVSAAIVLAACNQPTESAAPVTEEVPVETSGTDTESAMAEDMALDDTETTQPQGEVADGTTE